jgi:hypothetical protein
MELVLHPWHVLILTVSAWVNREQEQIIEYLLTENKVLREKLGNGRILLDDDQLCVPKNDPVGSKSGVLTPKQRV